MPPSFDDLRSRLKGNEKRVLERFLNQENETIAAVIGNEVSIDRQHTELVNYCAYAFTESGPAREAGFVFIRVEPLYLTGSEPRFDLVLYNAQLRTAILVECKSSIMDASETSSQMKAAFDFAKSNVATLERQVGQPVERIEQTLCTTPTSATKFIEHLKGTDEPVIVWTVDKFKDILLLMKVTDENELEIRRGRLHQSESLRRLLFNGVRSSGRFMHYLPSSHMCRVLTQVIIGLENDLFQGTVTGERRLTLADLERQIGRDLLNVERPEIAHLASQVITTGLECGVFRRIDETTSEDQANWELKIPFDTRGPAHVEKAVLGAYTKYKQHNGAKEMAVRRWEEFVETRPDRLRF